MTPDTNNGKLFIPKMEGAVDGEDSLLGTVTEEGGTGAGGDAEKQNMLHNGGNGELPDDTQPQQEDDGVPIDRGWAWVVLAGSFLNVVLMVANGRSIAIFFVAYLEEFEASATKTTLFMGVMAGTYSISSLISMNIILQLLGERKTVLLGGTISAVGMLTGVFATSITYLICTHSILIGIAMPFHDSCSSIGTIRDLTSSYTLCFNYIGICNFIAAIFLLCVPLVRCRASRMKPESSPMDIEENRPLKSK